MCIALSLHLTGQRPHSEGGAGSPWPTFAHTCICVAGASAGNVSLFLCAKARGKDRRCLSQPTVCCALLQAGSGRKGFPVPAWAGTALRVPPGRHSPRRWQLGESWWVHPRSEDGDGSAITPRVPLAAPPPTPGAVQLGCPAPSGRAALRTPVPVAVEGPMLPSAGSAAQEQRQLGSALLEVTPRQCALTLLPCPPPDPALGLLVASPRWPLC